MDISNIIKSYDLKNITIWVLGGHSALDVCSWAKKLWFKTLCIAKKGRELTYDKYYKTRDKWQIIGCIDECIVVNEWKDLLNEDIQEKLRKQNTIFIHNRYFWVYFDFKDIESKFRVPIYGSRELLKLEERDVEKNQYYLLEKAGIRIPKIWKTPNIKIEDWKLIIENYWEKIEWLTLTKVNNATRTYERENFVSSSWEEWISLAEEKLNNWIITLKALQNSVIEEFVLWAQINFNFIHTVNWEIELLGTDMRRQTNLDWFLRLPAKEQLKINSSINPFHIETWHVAVTCKESLLEKAFIAAENFVKACENETGQKLIWPFALQWAIETDGKKEELIVFDVSLRIPWSPWIWATPYSSYVYWRNVSMWERVSMDIKEAINIWRIEDILT